jgi:hypothetical protein
VLQDDTVGARSEVPVTIQPAGGVSGATKISILSHHNGDKISGQLQLEGIGPALANLNIYEVSADPEDDSKWKLLANGDTDESGHFAIPVKLDTNQSSYKLRVLDDAHRNDSGVIELFRDTKAPDVEFAIAPEQAVQGDDITVTVTTEPSLPAGNVTVKIGDNSFALTERAGKPGTYGVILKAPVAGEYQPTVTAKDSAGNITQLQGKLTVLQPELAIVQNLVAEGVPSGVSLHWDPIVNDTVDSYVIYVGTGSTDFSSSLDTGHPVNEAKILRLSPGVPYFFAVTAKKGDRESKKGATATATPIGLGLRVTPQDAALKLDWQLPAGTPVSTFLVEYYVDDASQPCNPPWEQSCIPPNYEKRVLEGAPRTTVLHDLINGVTYHLRLTPIAENGDVMSELTEIADGTPAGGTDFHTAAGGSTYNPNDLPPDNGLHQGAPEVTSSGLPTLALWTLLAFVAFAVLFLWRRKRTQRLATQQFLHAMAGKYRT